MAKIVLHDDACSLSEQGRAEYIKIQDDISLPEPARNVKPKSNRKKSRVSNWVQKRTSACISCLKDENLLKKNGTRRKTNVLDKKKKGN